MGKAKIRKLLNSKNSKGLENLKNFQSKLKGHKEQLKKHMGKFKEAQSRDAVGSMNYMAGEMSHYLKKMDKLKSRLLPKKKRKNK